MTEREMITHWKGHYDSTAARMLEAEAKVRKLERLIVDLKRTKIVTPNYEGQIDFAEGWGWLEHNEYGEENACRFFFDKNEDGTYTINDYEFCFEMNNEMLSCLNQHKIFLVEY
jgi:hypothetical protein